MKTKRKDLEEIIPVPPTLWMDRDEFFRQLFAISPEGNDIVSSQQAAKIWNLKSLYLYGIEARYGDAAVRLRANSKTDPLHKLTPQEKEKYFGAGLSGRNYFFLVDVLKIAIRPWKHKGLKKPMYLSMQEGYSSPISAKV